MKPFNVRPWANGPGWMVWCRPSGKVHGPFDSQGEAIDFAYKTWPWYL